MAQLATTNISARERLLEAASRLFYAKGMTATGINAIVAEASVAKMSFYNNFSSKEELIEAYILARHDEWLGLYRHRSQDDCTPAERVLTVFDAYIDHASAAYEHGFRGCGLLNAAAELPVGSVGRDAVRMHKEQVEAILTSHLNELVSSVQAMSLAEHFSFLLEGAMSRAGLEGSVDRLHHARDIAKSMIESL